MKIRTPLQEKILTHSSTIAQKLKKNFKKAAEQCQTSSTAAVDQYAPPEMADDNGLSTKGCCKH